MDSESMKSRLLDAQMILQAQLARGLGLDRYAEIMHGDLSSPEFQRIFNGYYRIRRNQAWRQCFYDLFVRANAEEYDFARIITELYHATGNVEASFSSKLLATINPGKPIWDQYVLQNLGLTLTGKTQEEKLANAIMLYAAIEQWYARYLLTSEAKENIRLFDRMLPDYTWVSDVKKID